MHRLTKVLTILSILLVSLPPAGLASPTQAEAERSVLTPLMVELVFSKYEGEELTSRLPYTFMVNGSTEPRSTQLRMGIEVPVTVEQGTQQYRNVGTNVDCRAHDMGDSSFRVELQVEQSSIFPATTTSDQSQSPLSEDKPVNPLFRTFSSNFIVVLQDGETMELTTATDPVSGEVSKVSISLKVLKK